MEWIEYQISEFDLDIILYSCSLLCLVMVMCSGPVPPRKSFASLPAFSTSLETHSLRVSPPAGTDRPSRRSNIIAHHDDASIFFFIPFSFSIIISLLLPLHQALRQTLHESSRQLSLLISDFSMDICQDDRDRPHRCQQSRSTASRARKANPGVSTPRT